MSAGRYIFRTLLSSFTYNIIESYTVGFRNKKPLKNVMTSSCYVLVSFLFLFSFYLSQKQGWFHCDNSKKLSVNHSSIRKNIYNSLTCKRFIFYILRHVIDHNLPNKFFWLSYKVVIILQQKTTFFMKRMRSF